MVLAIKGYDAVTERVAPSKILSIKSRQMQVTYAPSVFILYTPSGGGFQVCDGSFALFPDLLDLGLHLLQLLRPAKIESRRVFASGFLFLKMSWLRAFHMFHNVAAIDSRSGDLLAYSFNFQNQSSIRASP
ncbi:hypothetical protein BT93_F1492 [Corymbia citriodora subsp. variegata]|nr:hypothetical protein BT93_F1492 [Corymbia citriodora subsp. variegata]